MHFLYIGISSRQNEVERILSCSCTALCYIFEYIYIGQIAIDIEVLGFLLTCKIRPNILSVHKVRLAEAVEDPATSLNVMGSESHCEQDFFILYFFGGGLSMRSLRVD